MNSEVVAQISKIEQRNQRSQMITAGSIFLLGLILAFSPVIQPAGGHLFWQITGSVFMLLGLIFSMHTYRIFPFHRWSVTQWIHQRPKKIVWVYPYIVENMPYGIKLFNLTTLYFKLLDGNDLQLRCTPEEAYRLMDDLRMHLPHACFGYSQEKEFMYENDPEMLLRE